MDEGDSFATAGAAVLINRCRKAPGPAHQGLAQGRYALYSISLPPSSPSSLCVCVKGERGWGKGRDRERERETEKREERGICGHIYSVCVCACACTCVCARTCVCVYVCMRGPVVSV